MDNHTKEQRSYNMSRIRSTNSQLEQKFFSFLEENSISYIKHPAIYGKPDCKIGEKVLVFIDSDFWHGWHFSSWKARMPKEYWLEKIANNMKRDKKKFLKLKKEGYVVLRVWEHQLNSPTFSHSFLSELKSLTS